MNNRHREKLNNLLDKLQENSALRYQLLADVQLCLEDIDRKNNTLIHQEKFSQEQMERDLAAQKEKDETLDWIYNIQENIRRESELFEYEQYYFDSLKKNQETSLSMLLMTPEGRKLMEQMEEARKEQQHYIKEQDRARTERIEKLRQSRKDKKITDSRQNTTKLILTARNQMFFHGVNHATKNKKYPILESKEKKSINRSNQSKDNQDVSNDPSFTGIQC